MPKATNKSTKKATKKGVAFTLPAMDGDYVARIFEDIQGMTPKATMKDPAKKADTPIGVEAMATACRTLAMKGPNTFTLRIGPNEIEGAKNLNQVRIQFLNDGTAQQVALPRSWDPNAMNGPVIIVKEGKKAAVDAEAVKALEDVFGRRRPGS